MKAKGLGDSIANFTKKTGINSAVQAVSRAIGKPCGCAKRQETSLDLRDRAGWRYAG